MGLFGKNSTNVQPAEPIQLAPAAGTVYLSDVRTPTVRLNQTPAYEEGRDPEFAVIRKITYAESKSIIL